MEGPISISLAKHIQAFNLPSHPKALAVALEAVSEERLVIAGVLIHMQLSKKNFNLYTKRPINLIIISCR